MRVPISFIFKGGVNAEGNSFFTYTTEVKEAKGKTVLTVQLPALRFCKAPAAASRVLKFWLSVRIERYSRTTSGWYSNSKPAGGEEENRREAEKTTYE